MKSKIHKTKVLSVKSVVMIISICFIVIACAGIIFMEIAFSRIHSTKYLDSIRRLGERYLQGDENVRIHPDGIFLFDKEGAFADKLGIDNFSSLKADMAELAGRYEDKVKNGHNVIDFIWFIPKERGGFSSLTVYGTQVYDPNGTYEYAGIMIIDEKDALETAIGFIILLLVFYLVIVIIVTVLLHTIEKYENAQKQYIANITHELKSPIASVKGLTEALADGMTKSSVDESVYYGMILHEINKQEKMVNMLLELSKLQSRPDDVDIEKTAAVDLFAPVFEKYAVRCDFLDIKWQAEEKTDHLPELLTDIKLSGEVLDILLSNALKYSREKDGIIKIGIEEGRKQITVCVEDNGIGIDEADLPHICERFYRGSLAKGLSGSGLGLAVAAQIIDILHEHMWFESQPGRGTKAFFTIRTA